MAHKPMAALVLVVAFVMPAMPAVAGADPLSSVAVNHESTAVKVGRCDNGVIFGDCFDIRVTPRPRAMGLVGLYTAHGYATRDANGNGPDAGPFDPDNTCSFIAPLELDCNTDGDPAMRSVVVGRVFNQNAFCFGRHGVLHEDLHDFLGLGPTAESRSAGGCQAGGGVGEQDLLFGGETLRRGMKLQSDTALFQVEMQNDGNLVIYKMPAHIAVWATGTNPAGATAEMQTDGNFVVYNAAHTALWATNTPGNPGSILKMQNDCNLVLRNAGGTPIWASGTVNPSPTCP